MARNKIDYGIDLGTTNSAIARMEDGAPVIKKTDTLKDTMPSCVGFNKKKSTQAGDTAWNILKSDKLRAMRDWNNSSYNTFIEFKRTMGTDKSFHSSYLNDSFDSEQLSAEILKKLKSLITDDEFRSIVITVPAKFDIRQKDATYRAAKLAGFQHCELLQEPIAASMAYGLDSKNKDGYWLVFDFGGGTFDAALLKVEDGIMKVMDTDGDNYLGGKNLDLAMVDEIIIPYFEQEYSVESILADEDKSQILQEAMKYFAEEAKIQLSFNTEAHILSDLGDIPGEDDEGEEFELDITITQDDLRKVVAPIFQRAIDITKKLIVRNNLSGDKLDALILVGGPTFSPILREMLGNQIKQPDVSIDPMTAVARGAALYASTLDVSDDIKESSRDKTKIQLEVKYESSTVEQEEWISVKFLRDKTEGMVPEKLYVEIERGDKAWSSGKIAINEIGEIIEAKLNEGKPNLFKIFVYDEMGNRVPSEPDSFTIIQGSKIGRATLPYFIGVEIKRRQDSKLIFQSLTGLAVNQPLPAKGTINGLKTQKQLRPGIGTDFIKIPIYQADHGADGSRAIYNEHVYDVMITGDDIPNLLPEGSLVDLTLTTDKSGRVEKAEAFFPYLEHSAEIPIPEGRMKEVDAVFLENEINKAKSTLSQIGNNGHSDIVKIDEIEEEVSYLEKRLNQGRNDYDRKKEVLDNLRKSLRKIDELSEATEWPKLESELKDEFGKLEKANGELGNEVTTKQVNELRQQIDQVIREKDIKAGQAALEEVLGLYFSLTIIYQLIGIIRSFNQGFDNMDWADRSRARQLLNQGLQQIGENPTVEGLRPIVSSLYELLDDVGKESIDDSVLTM